MRKFIIGLALFACFYCFYSVGAYLKSYSFTQNGTFMPKTSLVTHKVDTTPHPTQETKPTQARAAVTVKAITKAIEAEKGATLMQVLQAGRMEPYSSLQRSIEQRFSAEYPRNEPEVLKEAASRMGILQEMSRYEEQAITNVELQSLGDFYQQTAANESEHPAVRRESLRRQLKLMGRIPEEDRIKTKARAGSRLASASKSAQELAEEIFQVRAR